MRFFEVCVLGVGLAMDAFAVSVCKGLSMRKIIIKYVIVIALYFGIFQAVMPVIGFLTGTAFRGFVETIDHWIAFVLLLIIGGNMIREWKDKEDDKRTDRIDWKTMLPLAVATSIDALAVGITFAFFKENIVLDALMIGVITFVISAGGVVLGNKVGDKFQGKAKLAGGIVLIVIGVKILLEHLGVLAF